jgi:hypothetical protein
LILRNADSQAGYKEWATKDRFQSPLSRRATDSDGGHVRIDRREGLRVFSDLGTATPLHLS